MACVPPNGGCGGWDKQEGGRKAIHLDEDLLRKSHKLSEQGDFFCFCLFLPLAQGRNGRGSKERGGKKVKNKLGNTQGSCLVCLDTCICIFMHIFSYIYILFSNFFPHLGY